MKKQKFICTAFLLIISSIVLAKSYPLNLTIVNNSDVDLKVKSELLVNDKDMQSNCFKNLGQNSLIGTVKAHRVLRFSTSCTNPGFNKTNTLNLWFYHGDIQCADDQLVFAQTVFFGALKHYYHRTGIRPLKTDDGNFNSIQVIQLSSFGPLISSHPTLYINNLK